MNNIKSHLVNLVVNLSLFAVLFIFHYSGLFTIDILGAKPIIPLSLLVAVCMFRSELSASLIGMILGFFMDSTSNHSSCFYTISFFLIGFSVAFTVHFFFNKNIRAALALSFIAGVLIFIARWAFIHINIDGIVSSIDYLLRYALPSAVFTSLFVIPFYYIQKHLNKRILMR